MPLRNSQYDTLMRRYEEIRETHRHELLSREAEIAEKIPGITFTTDLIVGFPTETAEQFEETLKLADTCRPGNPFGQGQPASQAPRNLIRQEILL